MNPKIFRRGGPVCPPSSEYIVHVYHKRKKGGHTGPPLLEIFTARHHILIVGVPVRMPVGVLMGVFVTMRLPVFMGMLVRMGMPVLVRMLLLVPIEHGLAGFGIMVVIRVLVIMAVLMLMIVIVVMIVVVFLDELGIFGRLARAASAIFAHGFLPVGCRCSPPSPAVPLPGATRYESKRNRPWGHDFGESSHWKTKF